MADILAGGFLFIALIVVSVLFAGYVLYGWFRQKFIGESCETDSDCGHTNLYCNSKKECAAGIPTITLDSCLTANACNNCTSICNQTLTKEKCNKAGLCPTCTP